MRRILVTASLLWLSAAVPRAQIVVPVHDPAVTLRNSLTAVLQEALLTTERAQHSQLRRMAMRLSLHADLWRYAPPDAPRWRTHDFETPFFAGDYLAALNYGAPAGAPFLAISHPVVDARTLIDRLTPLARREFAARLATIDVAEATTAAATHDAGRLRFNGRREQLAIDELESRVIDPSVEQSATAVLDKISGAVLIGGRQRQTRAHLLTGVLEQLIVDTKRARDTDTGAMNMQLVSLRDGRVVNKAFVAGSADALRAWRQP
jgi:hypothetical protein